MSPSVACGGREELMGMIGVDKIGQIRRAFFERHLPIKEIVRTLSVSRATVRKVIRGKATEFKYERGVQPAPKLGEWVKVLSEILEKEAKLPRRERRSTQRLFEELRGRGYFASNRDPSDVFVNVSFCGLSWPAGAYGDDQRGQDRSNTTCVFRAAFAD